MVPPTRRRVLAGAGASLAALSGCLSLSDDADEPERDGPDAENLPDGVATVLAATPDRVGTSAVEGVTIAAPSSDDGDDSVGIVSPQSMGVEPDDVEYVAHTRFEESGASLLVATGSFAADDVEAGEDAAVHADDEFAIVATASDGAWDGGLEAATVARGDPDLGVLAQYPVEELLEPLDGETPIHVIPEFPPTDVAERTDVDEDDVDMVAITESTADETTRELTFVFLFPSAEAADREVVTDLLQDDGSGIDDEDVTVEEDGRRIVTTVEEPLPSHELPDDSPDLHVHVEEHQSDAATFELRGEESAATANLELRLDGEPVADPPWSGSEQVSPGDAFRVEGELFATAEVVWLDPERDGVEHSLGSHTFTLEEAFEPSYDPDASRLTVTYVGDVTVDGDRLEIVHGDREEVHFDDEGEPLSERHNALEPGDEVVLEDVHAGEIVLFRSVSEERTYGRVVFHYFAEPPGAFEHVREDGRSHVVYRGETARPADHFRVDVRGEDGTEPADAQWTDEFETLSPGDRLALDLDVGTDVEVVWTGGDEPVPVQSFTVAPDVSFEFEHDEDADEVAITHAGGETLPADELEAVVDSPEPERVDAWSEFDAVSEGDSVVVDVPEDREEAGLPLVVAVEFRGVAVDHRVLETDPSAS